MYTSFEDMLNNSQDIEELREAARGEWRAAMAYEKAIKSLDPETSAKVLAWAFDYLRISMLEGMAEGEFKDFPRDLEMQRLREKLGDDFAEG